MSEERDTAGAADGPPDDSREPVTESLRNAVERTLAATAGSASDAGQRARELLDDVSRRGEAARDEVERRSQIAREEVGRRGHAARERIVRSRTEATEELARRGEVAAARLSEAIGELRRSDADTGPVREGLAAIESRLSELERALRGETGESSPPKGEANSQVEGERGPQKADSEADSSPDHSG